MQNNIKQRIQYKSSGVAEMAAQCRTSQIIAFAWGYLFLTQSFSVISANVAINHILATTTVLTQRVWVKL